MMTDFLLNWDWAEVLGWSTGLKTAQRKFECSHVSQAATVTTYCSINICYNSFGFGSVVFVSFPLPQCLYPIWLSYIILDINARKVLPYQFLPLGSVFVFIQCFVLFTLISFALFPYLDISLSLSSTSSVNHFSSVYQFSSSSTSCLCSRGFFCC